MSLLLDALKKAEKAKQEAQRKAESESGAPPPESGLRIADDTRQERPVRTRDQLPDISQSLRIESEDIEPAKERQAGESAPLELEPAAPPSSSTRSAGSSARSFAMVQVLGGLLRRPAFAGCSPAPAA